MSELSISQSHKSEPVSTPRGRIIVVVGTDQTLLTQVTNATARPLTVVENFYEAIGELTTTQMRNAPDAVIASASTFGSRLQEFSLALRKTDPAVTILAVAENPPSADADVVALADYVDAVLTLPLNRLELERAIQTADMAARQPLVLDNAATEVELASPGEQAASPEAEAEIKTELGFEVEPEVETNADEAVGESDHTTNVETAATEIAAEEGSPKSFGTLADRDLLEQLLQAPTPEAVAAALELQLMSLYQDIDCKISFETAALTDSHATPILHQGQLLALLVAEGLDPAERQVHADWSAPYLALAQQLTTYRALAYTDDLTGAHNRRYFNLVLPQALAEARKCRECVTLLLFDIDNFKVFNDRFGHPAGDRILTETVALLRSVIRPSDQVCRLGGDEFAVIFFDRAGSRTPGSSHPADMMKIAQRFQAQIAEKRFPELGEDAPGRLTISGGLATFPWDAHDAASLYNFADQAALAAKRSGKNVIILGPPE